MTDVTTSPAFEIRGDRRDLGPWLAGASVARMETTRSRPRGARCGPPPSTVPALDRVLPGARLTEVQSVELALPIDEAWEATRHLDLSRSRLVAALFTARTLPARLLRWGEEPSAAVTLGIDDLRSTPDEPGFQILVDEPPSEVVVGAIGQVWQLDIPFVHVPDADAFADYEEPDQVKVAWALQVDALDAEREGERGGPGRCHH